jgi:hypothetical protein
VSVDVRLSESTGEDETINKLAIAANERILVILASFIANRYPVNSAAGCFVLAWSPGTACNLSQMAHLSVMERSSVIHSCNRQPPSLRHVRSSKRPIIESFCAEWTVGDRIHERLSAPIARLWGRGPLSGYA